MIRWKWCMYVLTIMVVVLAACTSGQKEVAPSDSVRVNDATQTATSDKEAPVPITFYTTDYGRIVPPQKAMQIPTVQYVAEQTNTVLDIQFLAHGDYNSQLRLKFGAGEFPDVYMENAGMGDITKELIVNDRLLDITSLIEQHGHHLKRLIPEASWNKVSVDGKIYGIPTLAFASTNSTLYVRKDWMEEAGITTVDTSQDLLDLLRVFKQRDASAYPFSARQNFSYLGPLFAMWGLQPGGNIWHDGEVIPMEIHPRMKQVLGYIRDLYAEGLLDPDFNINSGDQWKQKILAGQVGLWTHVSYAVPRWEGEINDYSPDEQANLVGLPTPRGEGYAGPLGYVEDGVGMKSIYILKDAKDPVAIVKLWDWLASEEGLRFSELGIEGDTYTMAADGTITYDAEKDKANEWRWPVFAMRSFNENVEQAKGDPDSLEKIETAREYANADVLPDLTFGMPANLSTVDLRGMWLETAGQIVINQAPLEETFAQFVQTYRSSGGDSDIQYMTEWYQANGNQAYAEMTEWSE